MNNYIRFMRAYQEKFGIRFLDAVCRARDLYHSVKHLSWAEQQAAMDEDEGDDDEGDDGEDYDAELERQRAEQEAARRRLGAEREDQERRQRLNAIQDNERLRMQRLAQERLNHLYREQRLAQTANPLVRGFMARSRLARDEVIEETITGVLDRVASTAVERASAKQARQLAVQQRREQDDVRRLQLEAAQLRERDAMQGADVNAGVRTTLRPARRERRFTVSFGSDVSTRTRAAFQMQVNDPDYELAAVLREIKAGITGRASGISNKEAEENYFNKKGAGIGLYPYSILIVSREMDGTFVGFAVFHEIQMRRALSRGQTLKEKTDFEKKGIKPTFRYTGFGIDLMAARGGAADIVEAIYRTGEQLYGPEYIGLYLSAVSSAQPFYRKIGFIAATPLSQRTATGDRYAFMESSKELYGRRGQDTPEVFDIVDRDTYNMMKPPGLRGGSMEGGANAYIEFMHEWQRVHGGTFACAYMNGIDIYYQTKFTTRAVRDRAIRDWDGSEEIERPAVVVPALGPLAAPRIRPLEPRPARPGRVRDDDAVGY